MGAGGHQVAKAETATFNSPLLLFRESLRFMAFTTKKKKKAKAMFLAMCNLSLYGSAIFCSQHDCLVMFGYRVISFMLSV